MLTYSDRQKFEQIRAHWETAQPLSGRSGNMVGRKQKQVPHRNLNSDSQDDGGSMFHRKLSYGLSFISNPFSQRKVTPLRQSMGQQSRDPSITDTLLTKTAGASGSDSLLPPTCVSGAFNNSHSSTAPTEHDVKVDDPDATPKPLPRSRTMSFIPRPARSTSEASVTEVGSMTLSSMPAVTSSTPMRSPSTKIPSPSISRNGSRRANPYQCPRHYTPQQEKHIGAGAAFAGAIAQSPSKASIRSYTTPNLAKGIRPPQSNFMIARKPTMHQKSSDLLGVPRPAMKENTPTTTKENRRISYIQMKNSRHTSFMSPTTASNRRSLGPDSTLGQSKQRPSITPSNAGARVSTHLSAKASLTAKRVPIKKQALTREHNASTSSNGNAISRPRLMGPVNPPTPKPAGPTPLKPALPRASTDNNLRRGTFGTPKRLGGMSFSTRVESAIGPNTEVRLPRSFTFHHFSRRRETLPPVPPIPDLYKSPPKRTAAYNTGICHGVSDLSSFSIAAPRMRIARVPEQAKYRKNTQARISPAFITKSNDDTDTKASMQSTMDEEASWSLPMQIPKSASTFSLCARPFSVNKIGVPCADASASMQIKDYMPPLWWAGRFQARFDQWRNEAMRAELDPKYKLEGLLSQCQLSQEKTAACYIFLQLRDLCGSKKAADSLWEFECKYREDHKIPGTMAGFPSHKQDNAATSGHGPIGRAVRKLTPRKSSFVNLLKGKGWNRVDDAKPNFGFSSHGALSGASQGRSSIES